MHCDHCPPSAALIPSVSVPYEVRTSHAEPRALAAVRGAAAREQLGTGIIRMLDLVWPVLRGQGVRTGHNVVVYYGGLQNIAAGVEVFSDFTDSGEVQHLATPSGEVAMATHYGDYSEMRPAYAALEQWLADHGRRPAGVSWEVYGDWEDDPAKRRTDVYFLLEPEAA
jgi:hypothetical protein